MPWYAIRTVYHFGVKDDGTNVFEERVVCFNADSCPQAHQLAKAEADAYAKSINITAYSEQVGYEQDGDPLVSGYEIWSELYESNETLQEFYANRYSKYEYHPPTA
jgi:hypothetical protein